MNGFDWSNFGAVTAASVLVLAVLQAATFLVGRRIGRYNVVDVSWGLGFVLVALVAAVIGDGDTLRRWLVVVLVAVWGLRLTGTCTPSPRARARTRVTWRCSTGRAATRPVS